MMAAAIDHCVDISEALEYCSNWLSENNSEVAQRSEDYVLELLRLKPAELLPRLFACLTPTGPVKLIDVLVRFTKEKCKDAQSKAIEQFIERDLDKCLKSTSAEARLCMIDVLAPFLVSRPGSLSLALKASLHFHWKTLIDSAICCTLTIRQLRRWSLFTGSDSSIVRLAIVALLRKCKYQKRKRLFLEELGDLLHFGKDPALQLWMQREVGHHFIDALIKGMQKLVNGRESRTAALWIALLLRCVIAIQPPDQPHLLLWALDASDNPHHYCTEIACIEVYLEKCILDAEYLAWVHKNCQTHWSSISTDHGQESTELEVFSFLLTIHYDKRTNLNLKTRRQAASSKLCAHVLIDLQKKLLQAVIARPRLLSQFPSAVIELQWIASKKSFKDIQSLMKCMSHSVQLFHHWRTENDNDSIDSRLMKLGWQSSLSLFRSLLLNWPVDQHSTFFHQCCQLFTKQEIQSLYSHFEDQPLAPQQQCPISLFSALFVRQCEFESNDDNSTAALIERIAFVDFATQHCMYSLLREIDPFGNVQLNILYSTLQEYLLWDTMDDDIKVFAPEVLSLWNRISHKENLIKTSFLMTYMPQDISNLPKAMKNYFNLSHPCHSDSPMTLVPDTDRGLFAWKRFPEMAVHTIETLKQSDDKDYDYRLCQCIVTLLVFIAISHLCTDVIKTTEIEPQCADEWTSAVASNCIYVGDVIEAMTRIEMNRLGLNEEYGFVFDLLQRAAESAEEMLDLLEAVNERDFIQIRSTLEMLLNQSCESKETLPEWIQQLLSRYRPVGQSPVRRSAKPRRSVGNPFLTGSKSYIYSIESPSIDAPLDLREWFDDGIETASGKRRRRNGNSFLEACLRETGAAEEVDANDLTILENFIVPTEGRDYDDAFQRRYRFVDK